MDIASQYGHALLALAIYAIITQVLNAMTGIKKGNNGMVPGSNYDADFGNPDYRLDRAYMNSLELLVFTSVLIVTAILAGANPMWTNILASVILVSRIAANILVLRGKGGLYGGLRTGTAILISICNMGLGLLIFIAVIGG